MPCSAFSLPCAISLSQKTKNGSKREYGRFRGICEKINLLVFPLFDFSSGFFIAFCFKTNINLKK